MGSSGFSKFYVFAQGGPLVDNDFICGLIYEGKSCAEVCDELDNDTVNPEQDYPLCGTDGFFDDGSFTFEEWGLYYSPASYIFSPPSALTVGANHGLLNVIADRGKVNLRFGGLAVIPEFSGSSEDYGGINR